MRFLVKRPTVVGMIKTADPERIIQEAKRLIEEGADALGLQTETLLPENKTLPVLKKLFSSMDSKPIYVTNYRRFNVSDPIPDDEVLAGELLLALQAGASLIDIRGDMFHPEVDEFTEDAEAVKKQKELIREIHSLGGEALISTHIFHFTPRDEIMKIAYAMYERGADIAKIVSYADTEDELEEAFKITKMLKASLPIPALFLINGAACRRHRYEAPLIERSMFLTVEEARKNETQPTVKEARQLIDKGGCNK